MGLLQLFKTKKAVEAAAVADPTLLQKIVVNYGEVDTDKGDKLLFDGDTITENMPIYIMVDGNPDPQPVPDGSYLLTTGDTIEVQSGVVTSYKEKVDPNAAAAAATPATPATPAAATPKSVVQRHEIESYFKEHVEPKLTALTTENEALKKTNEELNKKVIELGEQAKSTPAATILELEAQKKQEQKNNNKKHGHKIMDKLKNI